MNVLTLHEHRTLNLESSNMWFLDFGLLMKPYSVTQNKMASTVNDIVALLASDYRCKYLLNPTYEDITRGINLSPPGRRFFAKIRGKDLGLGNEPVTRKEVVRAAVGFGLQHCPTDAALFTHIQTRHIVGPGSDLGEVLYFPSNTFSYGEKDSDKVKKSLFALHTPLDFTELRGFDDEENFDPYRSWAFEIPTEKINAAEFSWGHNRLSVSTQAA